MKMSAKLIRKQLRLLRPLVNGCSLKAARAGQKAMGELMSLPHRSELSLKRLYFGEFECEMITPEHCADPDAAIIYLHGGGYVAGDIEYARGFGSVLADLCRIKVFCPAYRLAPEHRFPTALNDSLFFYRHMTSSLGILPQKTVLCGESAGGGLIYSLCISLLRNNEALPSGLVAMSPWTDLTMSGGSYSKNTDKDPSMTLERLKYFSSCYTDTPSDPLASPLFADLSGMPPSLILSGGDEIMLDDALGLDLRLKECGAQSRHVIKEEMWHAYPLYLLDENRDDLDLICQFIKERIINET